MTRVLLVDNYDSFSFNVVQALRGLGAEVIVRRNDHPDVRDGPAALALAPTHLVVSPGPGHPAAAGTVVPLLQALVGVLPVLGVCLGHQALAVALGATVRPARALVHGESCAIRHDGQGLFRGLPQPLTVGRYHSLAVVPDTLPACLRIAATAPDGEVMAMRTADPAAGAPAFGVQFHPESVLTPDGPALLDNFLSIPTPAHLRRSA